MELTQIFEKSNANTYTLGKDRPVKVGGPASPMVCRRPMAWGRMDSYQIDLTAITTHRYVITHRLGTNRGLVPSLRKEKFLKIFVLSVFDGVTAHISRSPLSNFDFGVQCAQGTVVMMILKFNLPNFSTYYLDSALLLFGPLMRLEEQ